MKPLPLIVKTFIGFLWLVAMATPAAAAPDLVPILTAPQNGAFGVRNAGTTAAGPTLLLVGCNTTGSGPICPIVPPDLRATYSHPAFPYHALVIRVPALQPGERFDHQVLFWNQRCWPAGTYRIPVQADGADSESENDEANNHDQSTFVSQLRNCPNVGLPDLVPILTTPPNGTVGVRNAGSSGAVPTLLFVNCFREGGGSCPQGIVPNLRLPPTFPARVSVPALRPGQRFVHHLRFWNQLCWPAGSYRIIATADGANSESEGSMGEANNSAVSTLVSQRVCPSGVPRPPFDPSKPPHATPVPAKPTTPVVPAVPQPTPTSK